MSKRRPGSRSRPAVGPVPKLAPFDRRRWLLPVVLVAAIAVGLLLRAVDLSADPPADLSWSYAIYSDEAHNSYTARNLALYGSWKVDEYVPFVVYPLANLLVLLFYKLFGVGLAQIRLMAVLTGGVCIWALYWLVRRDAGRTAGVIAAVLGATCYPLVMYSRLGLAEILQVLLLLLAGGTLARGWQRPTSMVLAGFLGVGTALFVKVSGLFVVPAAIVVFGWRMLEQRGDPGALRATLRSLGWWFLGAAAAVLIWLLFVFLPHRADYVKYVIRHSLEAPAGHPATLGDYLFNVLTLGAGPRFYERLPYVVVLGMPVLPVLAAGRRHGLRFLAVSAALGMLMLGYMNYHPPRYELFLVPVFVAGFAVVVGSFLETGRLVPRLRTGAGKALLLAVWLWLYLGQLGLQTNGFWGTLRPESKSGFVVAVLVGAIVLVGIGVALARLQKREMALRPVALRAVLTALLLLLVLRLDLAQYFRWWETRAHRIVEYSAELDRILPDDAILGGFWAPALLANSRKRALFVGEQWAANSEDPIGRNGMTHLVSHGENDTRLLERLYPGIMRRARELRSFQVRNSMVRVLDLFPSPQQ